MFDSLVISCVSSGLCDELVTRPEGSYRARARVCDQETSAMERPRSDLGCRATEKTTLCVMNLHITSDIVHCRGFCNFLYLKTWYIIVPSKSVVLTYM